MIMECISAVAVLGVVVIGLLATIHAISIEEALHSIVKLLVFIVLSLVAWCTLRSFVHTVLIPSMFSLLKILIPVAVFASVVAVFAMVARLVGERHVRIRKTNDRGEP